MHPLLKFILRRLLFVVTTLLVITAALYGIIMLAPAEARAELYLPPRTRQNLSPAIQARMMAAIIRDHGLDAPYPVQYARWMWSLLRGEWGWSPVLNTGVLPALLARTPATAELTLYSVALLVPLGLAGGDVGGMVILDAPFTFIGIGGSSPWGGLLVAGRDYVIGMGGNPLAYWWTFLPATLALILFGIGWNLLGDGLNRLLDPRAPR